MSGSIPINFAALAKAEATEEANEAIGAQVAAEDDMMASSEETFNSMAASRAQSRYNRFKSLDGRRMEKAKNPDAPQDVKKTEGAQQQKKDPLADAFQRRNYELSSDKLKDIKDQLSEEMSEKDILETVEKSFPDPSLADEVLDFLEQSLAPPLKEKVSRVRQLLNEEKKREIVGGKNIDTVAKDFAARGYGASPTALRDLYRDVSGSERDHNALFDLLTRQYPFEQLKEIVAFLMKSLTFDMKSKGPSISEAELMRLMKEMKDLQSILWVFLFFKERMTLIKNLYSRQGLPYPDQLDFEILAKSFMKIVADRFPSMLKASKEIQNLGLQDPNEQIIILSQYRDAVRGLSPRLYSSVKHKQDVLLALIEALDKLEAELESEE